MEHGSFLRHMTSAIVLFVFICLSNSCNSHGKGMQKVPSISLLPKGDLIIGGNFTGKVWLNRLVESDTVFNINAGNVTFEAGARTHWHYHPGGQILLVTEGKGRYQEEGLPVKTIRKGEVIRCEPSVRHWHGASPDSAITHIAIGTNQQKGAVVWLKPVTDQEYDAIR